MESSYNVRGNSIITSSKGTDQQGSDHSESFDDMSEDSDEDSSSSNLDNKIAKLDREFKKLLYICNDYEKSFAGNLKNLNNKSDIINDKAKCLYLKGMVCEKDSNITDALQYYRKATKLIPEIDIHISKALDYGSKNKYEIKKAKPVIKNDDMPKDLLKKFSDLKTEELKNDNILKAIQHNTTNCLLLVKIPKEILLYIFRWAVSNELDLKCLETLGKVCRTFYSCTRDKEIWYLACKKVWGKERIKDLETKTSAAIDKSIKPINWRLTYIEGPHPRFEGCYVSKATYWRYGEANPENSYLPCYAIRHFRYLKFNADGQRVCALTSPEAPHVVLPKMSQTKFASETNELLHGRYQLITKQTLPRDGNVNVELSVVLTKKTLVETRYSARKNSTRATHKNHGELPSNLTTYYMKFSLHPNARGRPNCKLMWKHYSIFIKYSNGNKSKTVFDLSQDKYPPFSFNPMSWKWSGDIKAPLA